MYVIDLIYPMEETGGECWRGILVSRSDDMGYFEEGL